MPQSLKKIQDRYYRLCRKCDTADYGFIKERSPAEFTGRYEERIIEVLLKFENTILWPPCPELPTKDKRYRHIVFENYRIIGKVLPDKVYILDVFHTRRNPLQLKKRCRIK